MTRAYTVRYKKTFRGVILARGAFKVWAETKEQAASKAKAILTGRGSAWGWSFKDRPRNVR